MKKIDDDKTILDDLNFFSSNSPQNQIDKSKKSHEYTIVKRDVGPSIKDKNIEIRIETSVKGLRYRTDVFENGKLIDSRERIERDLENKPNKNHIFEKQYTNLHKSKCEIYISQIQEWKELLRSSGLFEDGRNCLVVTDISGFKVRVIVYVDGTIVNESITEIAKVERQDTIKIQKKYHELHEETKNKFFKKDVLKEQQKLEQSSKFFTFFLYIVFIFAIISVCFYFIWKGFN